MPKKVYRPRRKVPLRKAKKVVARSKAKAAKKNMDTFFLKARTLGVATPVQGIQVANYLYGWSQLTDGNLLQNAEFNVYRLQYDKFRVNSVTVKWTPKANVFDAGAAQNDTLYQLGGDGCIHTCIDRDNQARSSVAAISRYPSYKKYSLLKKWSRTYSVKYPVGVWLDCRNPSGLPETQGMLGLYGGVTFYAENVIEDYGEVFSEPIAEIELSWNVVFQGKLSGSLSFAVDASGNVTNYTLTPFDSFESLPLTPLRNIRGTIADTRIDMSGGTDISDNNIDDLGNDITTTTTTTPP